MCKADIGQEHAGHRFKASFESDDQPAVFDSDDEDSDEITAEEDEDDDVAYEDFDWDEAPLYRIPDNELAELERDVGESEPWDGEMESEDE